MTHGLFDPRKRLAFVAPIVLDGPRNFALVPAESQ